MLTPIDFGLPEKFVSFRPDQLAAIDFICDTPKRFVMVCAPTGFGKTLAYIAAAHMSGVRTVCLTSTRGLQDQLTGDFSGISTDIRGMQNYKCSVAQSWFGFPPYTRVADAPCQSGAKCSLRAGGCEYFDRYRVAQSASIVTTNYQCWMHDAGKQKASLTYDRDVDMLVLDEAHDAIEELSSYLSVELERKDCLAMGLDWPKSGTSQNAWREWVGNWWQELEDRRKDLEASIAAGNGVGAGMSTLHEIREIKSLQRKLSRVKDMVGEWVIEEMEGHGDSMKSVKFDPLWPMHYREHLFRSVEKVVFVSATVRPKTAELLGVPASDLAFMEYRSSFPVERRPVVWVPTVRMNHRTEADDSTLSWWLRKNDLLMGARADRKGIFHSVSYKRARFLLDNSEHKHRMIVHGSDNRAEAIERYKRAGPGAILVSPSVDTGYDFAGDLARYQIIGKIPYPDTRGAVLKARTQKDRDYAIYLTAQTLQQMTGRICRSVEDWGETLVTDDSIQWVTGGRYRRFFNQWWISSLRKSGPRLPEPLNL